MGAGELHSHLLRASQRVALTNDNLTFNLETETRNSKLTMIGVFDSGFGGLMVLREFLQLLPDYDYLYLGDNARIPYGTRSDRVVQRFTEQAVDYLFAHGCQLIVLACHTASARALRRIQQVYLPERYPDRRVLGVLIPTVEEALARSRPSGSGSSPPKAP